jgi:pyruvate/2-oxoglutarate/acetoin dehydrogenase E1 component
MSNSDNAARPTGTFAGEINRALTESLAADPNVVLMGQLIKYGFAGLTTGLYEKYPNQFITTSVSESLMNSATMGLSLAGKRPVCMHVRIDFLASGMCALVNHIPIWYRKLGRLPLVILCQVGKGNGQGAQHSKDLTVWFKRFEGWEVRVPQTPTQAYGYLKESIFGDRPVLYTIHRELFDLPEGKVIPTREHIRLCGTSKRHEEEFYR